MKYVVEMILKATDRATAPVRAVSRQMNALRGRVSAFGRSIGAHRVTDSVRNLGRSIGGLAGQVGRLLGPMAALTSLAGVGLFAGWISSTAAASDQLAKFASRTGISVEAVQRFEYAMGKMAGVGQQEVRDGLRDLVKNIGEAASGASGEMESLFAALRIDPNEVKNNTGRALELLADRFERIPDAATRAAIANRLFGETGAKMAEALHQGSAAIRDQASRLDRFGMISAAGAKEAERHANRMADLSAAFGGFGVAIQEKVLPAIGPWIDYLTEVIVAHKDMIATDIAGFVDNLARFLFGASDAAAAFANKTADGLPIVGGFVGQLAKGLDLVLSLSDAVGGFGNLLGIVIAAGLAPMAASLVQVGMAVGQLGIALLTTPIGWIVAGIAALVAGGVLLYRNFEPVQRLFDSLFDGVTDKIDRVASAFQDGFLTGLASALMEFNPLNLMIEGFMGIVRWIQEEWGDMISKAVSDVGRGITEKFKRILPDFLTDDDAPAESAGGPLPLSRTTAPAFVPGRMTGEMQIRIVDETGRAQIDRQSGRGMDITSDLETGRGLYAGG